MSRNFSSRSDSSNYFKRRVSKIIVLCGQDIIAETVVNLSRPDVAQVHPVPYASNSGFSTILATSAIPRQIVLTIAVVLHNGETIKLGEIN